MQKYLRPRIDYRHVLSELSVNRKNPCEIIRELISNSYDAEASQIEIYPLLQYTRFIFFDNGSGISEKEEIRGVTPWEAFFSIGPSTKTPGNCIGYKCQGSKLCFAARKFALITRCKQHKEKAWRSIVIDNPKDKLNPDYDIQSEENSTPWQTLTDLLIRPDERTTPILKRLNEDFFKKEFTSGTMILVQDIEIENFTEFYGTDNEYPYIRSYIRFNTRHGDPRILRPSETGFPPSKALSFQNTIGYNEQSRLFLWEKGSLLEIPAGYPYLAKPDESEQKLIKSPAEVSRLRDGRFYARGAATFTFEGRTYGLILAIDGNRRALDNYEELDRRGRKRSGIRLTDHRGTFVCSQGVNISPYNELFEHSKLEDYAVLGKDDGQSHYIFIIHGNFEVVTNRNSLSESAIKILNSEAFLDKVREFFSKAMRELEVFRDIIRRLNKEIEYYKTESYLQQFDELKNAIPYRARLQVLDVEQLNGKWLLEPQIGEEHWVGALYTLFSNLVPTNSPYAHLWMYPRTFAGIGMDSLAVSLSETSLQANVHKGLEYKFTFSTLEEFNHPLIITEQVVCWKMPIPESGESVSDSYGYFGEVLLSDELNGIGYEITNIQNIDGEPHGRNVKIISLKNLIDKTFSCQWVTPPLMLLTPGKKKKGGKRSK